MRLLQVDVYTAYYDRNRCFKETLTGQFSVTVAGGWFPRTIANRAHAFCAYVRCMLIAVWIAITALRYAGCPSCLGKPFLMP